MKLMAARIVLRNDYNVAVYLLRLAKAAAVKSTGQARFDYKSSK